MTPDTPAAEKGQGTPLTQNQAAEQFLSLLTPKGPETTAEPQESTESTEATAPADPSGSPDAEGSDETGTTEAAETATEATPEAGQGDQRTVEELKRDLLADHTRKTMAAAEERKKWEAEAADARAKRQAYAERLTAVEEALKSFTAAEPDAATLDQLRKENPAEYAAVRADIQANRDRLAAVQAEKERVRQDQLAEQAKLAEQRFAEERDKILAAVPEWKDPAKAEAAGRELVATAQQYGFTGPDIAAGFNDSRIVLLLRDAAAYRQLKAKVPDTKKKVEALKTATPGAQRTPDRGIGEKKALERLSQSGRKDDAAAVFLERSKQRT
ncbi:MAG TPA: hypothetical protein VJS69_02445 [Candidatus Krumholzibacteria bacterium]|nr:hypothetical protein [Candidatus Krumholzibacteria bacterium]